MMMVLVCFWNVTGLASSTDVLISLTFVQQTMDSAVLLTLSLWRNNCKIGQNIIFYLMTYQKLLGVLWSLFILRLTQKKFAGKSSSTFNLNFFFWHFIVMSSASGADDEAPTTSTSKQTNFSQIFIPKLKVEYKSWERFFSKMVRLNVIKNWTMNNFYLKREPCH